MVSSGVESGAARGRWCDAFRSLHGDVPQFSQWQPRRTGPPNGLRLDHLFVSPSLVSSVRATEYVSAMPRHTLVNDPGLPPELASRTPLSDHAALVVELKTD